MPNKKSHKALLLILSLSLILAGCKTDNQNNKEFSNLLKGQSVPAFSLLEVDMESDGGAAEALLVDKAVVGRKFIYFLMSSCSSCQQQTPVVVDLWQSVKGEDPDLDFICIARGGGNSSYDAAKAYWSGVATSPQEMPPLYYDTERVVFDMFASSNVPRFYMTDSQGVIVWQGEGVISTKEELQRYIDLGR